MLLSESCRQLFSSRSIFRSRAALLAGVSVIALTTSPSAYAGDILRGNAAASPVANVTAQQAAVMVEAQKNARRAANSLSNATRALQAMRSAQAAARKVALEAASGVPDGLVSGGLEIANGAMPGATDGGAGLWQGAELPTENVSNGHHDVTVKQNEQKAILTWDSFNVGKDTTLKFNQDDKNWVALNRVTDAHASPSKILGGIEAPGQVYVVNRNGIVFGGSSQVNVHSLVVSSLSLSNDQFMAGINTQLHFFQTGGAHWAIPTFGDAPDESPYPYGSLDDPRQPSPMPIGAPPADVVVEAGAQIEMADGGKALLFAPHVTNAGTISAPDGQVILAAGEWVYVKSPSQYMDNTLRGVEVAVSAPSPFLFNYNHVYAALFNSRSSAFYQDVENILLPDMTARAADVEYEALNSGIITVPRGNITMQGRAVVQNGGLYATTALNNKDGSIDLRAWGQGLMGFSPSLDYNQLFHWEGGDLTIGEGSVALVMPEIEDTSTIEGTSVATRYAPGSIDLRGFSIDVEKGASLIVPSGDVTVIASSAPAMPLESLGGFVNEIVNDGSRFYLSEDAVLSVAGLDDIVLSVSSNIVEAEFRINELRDSTLYRDSWLRGTIVHVDKRENGVFGDGPMSAVDWIEGEPGAWQGTPLGDLSDWIGAGLTTLGELSSFGGNIVLKSSGDIVLREGSLVDVSGGLVRYEGGYVETTRLVGADGRLYDIGKATPDMVYVGIAGDYTKVHERWGVTETWYNALNRNRRYEPGYTEGRSAGSLTLFNGAGLVLDGDVAAHAIVGERQSLPGDAPAGGTLTFGGGGLSDSPWLSSTIVVTENAPRLDDDFDIDSALPTDFFDPDASDFTRSAKTLRLDANVLERSGLGEVNFYYNKEFSLMEDTDLQLAPGAIFNAYDNVGTSGEAYLRVDGTIRVPGGEINLSGNTEVRLSGDAMLAVSGEWVNDFSGIESLIRPPSDAGSIRLISHSGAVTAENGAVLNVSGGARLSYDGAGGSLAFGKAGSITLLGADNDAMAALDMRAFSPGGAGSLIIDAENANVQVGGETAEDGTLLIDAGLFSGAGFGHVSIDTSGDIVIPDGVEIAPRIVSADLQKADLRDIPTGTPITEVGELRHIADIEWAERGIWEDRPGASITLDTSGGDLSVGSGSRIILGLGGQAGLDVQTGHLQIDGVIEAPAGVIDLQGNNTTFGENTQLLARGATLIYTEPDTRLRGGKILPGGSVSFTADMLSVDPDSLVDVSGAAGIIDDPANIRGGGDVLIASDGGAISIVGEGILDMRLHAAAGGPGASGGSLLLRSPTGGADMSGEIQNMLILFDPDVMGVPGGDGQYDGADAIGFDWAPVFVEYGLGTPDAPMIITQEMVDALQGGKSNMLISETATGGSAGAALDPADFGWTPLTLSFASMMLYPVQDVFDAYNAPAPMMVVRPGAINHGGFGHVSFDTHNAPLTLDGVSVSAMNSMHVGGALLSSGAAATSSLHAPYLYLNGTYGSSSGRNGTLSLDASIVDIGKSSIRGFSEATLSAGRIRFVGWQYEDELGQASTNYISELGVDGDLILSAAQVYPDTGVSASITSSSSIMIEQNGMVGKPLSAGGSLHLSASDIFQNGTLLAPFGSITLEAQNEAVLGAGSLTSVSGQGLLIPYGALRNGEEWIAPNAPFDPQTGLFDVDTAPPEKRVTLNAPSVKQEQGATIDITGGGDLYAHEYVPGPGGSHDVLKMDGLYAIVPSNAGAANRFGDHIWLEGGNGLAAGWYNLLPGEYALLPGAYAVHRITGSKGTASSGAKVTRDGAFVMSGRLGSTYDGSAEALNSLWRVMDGETVRDYSEYNEVTANSYYSSDVFKLLQYRRTGANVVTPLLPRDAGSVALRAANELLMDGTLLSKGGEGGQNGVVDIAGSKIAVIGAGANTADLDGYLVLTASQLVDFGVQSLLLGGIRGGTAEGTSVDVITSDIIVRNDESSAIRVPEIIFSATDSIDIEAGSVLVAEGNIDAAGNDLIMTPQRPVDDSASSPASDYGALVRLSTGQNVRVIRTNVDTAKAGTVEIGAGARLNGGNSLVVDATYDTLLSGSAVMSGNSLTLGGSAIGFGGGSSGLIFDGAALSRFSSSEHINLVSYSSIDFYTGIDFSAAGLASVTLDGAMIAGRAGGDIVVQADTITLRNSSGNFVEPGLGGGGGSLRIVADELVLGGGAKALRGFGGAEFAAAEAIIGEGDGSLDAGDAALSFVTPLITGRQGAGQDVATNGSLIIGADGAEGGARDTDSLGARWTFEGNNVVFAGRVDALGGNVRLTSTGGDVVVADGALIDVGGFGKSFYDVIEYASAGSVALTAVGGGGVSIQDGARIDLSAASGGNGGKLSAVANGGGTVMLDGDVNAHAQNGEGGRFSLDIAELPSFASLSAWLEEAGFNTSREYRVRNGDVRIDGVTNVGSFELTADQGLVTVSGAVSTVTAYGGSISIAGGGGLRMENGATLTAGSTTALGGGRVLLDAGDGRLDVQGGAIDVSGGEGGRVRFRARQTGDADYVAVDRLAASITGARSAVLEGVAVYSAGTTSSVQAGAMADAAAFAGHAAGIAARLGGVSGVDIMPGIEVRSAGDLVVDADWDLSSLSAHQGGLTLRAAGNLDVAANISDGFDAADTTGNLLNQASWDLRVVSGADLSGAGMLVTAPAQGFAAGEGAISVGADGNRYVLRTGTGDLSVAAGTDISLQGGSSMYTAGRKDETVYSDFVQNTRYASVEGASAILSNPVWALEGGNLSIKAGQNISVELASDEGQLFSEWLPREGALNQDGVYGPYTDSVGSHAGQQPAWWVEYAEFKYGVGALGGGNVAVSAGQNISDVNVVLPTNGRVRGGRTEAEARTLVMLNGGALDVDAGDAILGGQYYVGRGAADISAGSLGVGRTIDIYMEQSIDPVAGSYSLAPILAVGDAAMRVTAAGDLTIQTMVDPLMTALPYGPSAGSVPRYQYGREMSGYTDNTSVELVSIGGNVTVGRQTEYIRRGFDDAGFSYTDPNRPSWHVPETGDAAMLYPAKTAIAALNGSISNEGTLLTLPSTQAELKIIAADDIDPGRIIMATNRPDVFPSPFMPGGSPNGAPFQNNGIEQLIQGLERHGGVIDNPDTLLLANDFSPSRIYALGGSVTGGHISANEQIWVEAGLDVRGNTFLLRNNHRTDTSRISAGNDILSGTVPSFYTSVVYYLRGEVPGEILVEGPGSLLMTAGRDIYGQEFFVYSTGNRAYDAANQPFRDQIPDIAALPDQGATIEMIAGLNGQEPDYDAFANTYLDPENVTAMPDYLTTVDGAGTAVPLYLTDAVEISVGGTERMSRRGLISFVEEKNGKTLEPLEAWEVFKSLPDGTQQTFVRQIYMQELREAGRDQNSGILTGGYERGYAAIETLFPGGDWTGEIQIGNALFRTMSGGDIRLMAPGGGMQVAALGTPVNPGYGIVTLGKGAIDVFTKESVAVNRSRVLTFAGGDVTIWSTYGDVDAGRGAKTTRVPTAPEIETDEDGVTRLLEKADMSGSGIGTILGFGEVEPGDVDLIAPRGTVNAGDAGIRVSGNLNIAARFVVNADNIDVAGEAKGLPPQETSLSISIDGNEAQDAASDAVDETIGRANQRSALPSIITVEVLGYGPVGGVSASEEQPERQETPGRQSYRYDPESPFQVLSVGALSEADAEALAQAKRLFVRH